METPNTRQLRSGTTGSSASDEKSKKKKQKQSKTASPAKSSDLTKEIQQKYGSKPEDILCGRIPEMLELIIGQQALIISEINDIKSKVTHLEESYASSQESSGINLEKVRNSIDQLQSETKTLAMKQQIVPLGDSQTIREMAAVIRKKEKKRDVKTQCKIIKSSISTKWADLQKQRSKYFRNFVKNEKKAALYNSWIENSPNYLPLKYRPKRIPGEIRPYTDARVKEARQKYHNDCQLLQQYAQIHEARFKELDTEARQMINKWADTSDQDEMLSNMWKEETEANEARAQDTWNRNERFLKRKKYEDERHNLTVLTEITWEEKLDSYCKQKGRNVNQEYQRTPSYSTQNYHNQHPGPWTSSSTYTVQPPARRF